MKKISLPLMLWLVVGATPLSASSQSLNNWENPAGTLDWSAGAMNNAATYMVAQSASSHLDKYGRSESYWRDRIDRLRENLRSEEQNYDILVQQERECESKTGSVLNCTVRFRDRKIHIEQRIENLKKNIEIDLPEEARKADAYPGWLR